MFGFGKSSQQPAPQQQSPTQQTASAQAAQRSRSPSGQPLSSTTGASPADLFIKSALEQIVNAKEAKKVATLKDSVKNALDALASHPHPKSPTSPTAQTNVSPDVLQTIFTPFREACQSKAPALISIAIDCLGKLFSYNYWGTNAADGYDYQIDTAEDKENGADDNNAAGNHSRDASAVKKTATKKGAAEEEDDLSASGIAQAGPQTGILNSVIDTICDCFVNGDVTDDKVQLQVIKALLSAVSTNHPSSTLHGGTLLRAIRTTYNIFLFSKSANTQTVAQATLTQMIQTIFLRIPKTAPNSAKQPPAIKTLPPSNSGEAKIENGAVENSEIVEKETEVDGELSDQGSEDAQSSEKPKVDTSSIEDQKETIVNGLYIKDAYLIFRALCKLSMKPTPVLEGATDLKTNAVRSKLLSLHLLHSILTTHQQAFLSPAPTLFSSNQPILFIHAVKQYLCLSLSRNSTSVVPQVFEISMEIWSHIVIGLRNVLKKELSVLFTELILPILEAKSSTTYQQRLSLLRALTRLLHDCIALVPAHIPNRELEGARILVEVYLNYDCDVEGGAGLNIWERIINALSKNMATPILPGNMTAASSTLTSSVLQTTDTLGSPTFASSFAASNAVKSTLIPPALTTATLGTLTKEQVKELYSSQGDPVELKKRSLELLVRGILKPLVAWCNYGIGVKQGKNDDDLNDPIAATDNVNAERSGGTVNDASVSTMVVSDPNASSNIVASPVKSDVSSPIGMVSSPSKMAPPVPPAKKSVADDPTQFESMKQRKQMLQDGVKKFNWKPKKGIALLLESGIIPAKTPQEIAKFLYSTKGLDKKMLGEYMGEGEEENIAIMHGFVDQMDFVSMRFVDALRMFLQSFRLPGEAQKIDRFMLKFAERYLKGNPATFSSADTAYVLAYSTIMLNTDLHNPQVKKRMKKEEFLRNNRGIDEGKDIDAALLESIYDEIQSNEIKMKDDPMAANLDNADGDPKKGKKPDGVEFMAQKTEAMFTELLKTNKRGENGQADFGSSADNQWFKASHHEHVKNMFQIIWMSILTSISNPLQESEDVETIALTLEGFKHAIHIVCLFDMELERKAFVSTLSKYTLLSNLTEMKPKNVEAIKMLLEIAYLEGNYLDDNWRDVVSCVSQLDRLNLIGGDAKGSVGPLTKDGRTLRSLFVEESASETSSQQMVIAVDKIFSSSVKLSGSAIVEFVRSLCATSWEEITLSSNVDQPRMYCLQKLVEISYYNMKRIRMEWSNIWAILGDHFNQVGCHQNANIGYFALDKLRQLSMKFLEIEELPNFKFQKEFLRPFEQILVQNPSQAIKDMVLACLQQMIQARAKSIKSGWKTMLSVFTCAAKENIEPVVSLAFDIIRAISKSNLDMVIQNNTFPDYIACLVEFCKNRKYGKTSLQAIEIIKGTIPEVANYSKLHLLAPAKSQQNLSEQPSTPLPGTPVFGSGNAAAGYAAASAASSEDPSHKLWFPTLFGLYEVIMTCDLEVRTRALNYLFDTLKAYGTGFSTDFWDVVAKGVLFPIFDDLKLSRSEASKFENKEDMSIWLSTTLIQALRNFVDLFSFNFSTLSFLMDGVLSLLSVCMTQENETLARIGSTCLQQLIENNFSKFTDAEWSKITDTFVHLFDITTPQSLFDANLTADEHGSAPPPPPPKDENESDSGATKENEPSTTATTASNANVSESKDSLSASGNASSSMKAQLRKKEFQVIIVKCVLHLLVIQTLHETLNGNEAVYRAIPCNYLLKLMDCLERSFRFAEKFNGDMDLRMTLYKMGFMKQLPNLLNQETSSASSYVALLIKMYSDEDALKQAVVAEVEKRFIPLSMDLLVHFNSLDPEKKRRNVNAWRPVIVTILQAVSEFEDSAFVKFMPQFYPEVVNLLIHELTPETRIVLYNILSRTGYAFKIAKAPPVSTTSDSIQASAASLSNTPQ